MLNPKAFAHASTIVTLVLYAVCRFLALAMPDFLFSIGRSWFHTFSLDAARQNAPFNLGTFVFGGVALAVLTWVATYYTIVLYNRLAK